MTGIRIVHGYVEQQQVKPHGGRAQTKASNIKLQAAERLEALVGGTLVGRGVENTDTLKEGTFGPVERLEIAIVRVGALRARIDRALASSAETDAKARARADLVASLRRKVEETKDAALSIWRDLPANMGSPELAVRFVAAMGGMSRAPLEPKMMEPKAPERCPKCHRLLAPPKGTFGCMCE